MAMTKKERAALEAALQAARIAKAFRFTDPVAPDMPPPKLFSDEINKGWLFSTHGRTVYKACSSSVHHGNGWERTSSQHPRALYSTRLRALQALRSEIEREYAQHLAAIDAEIEGERPATGTGASV